VRGFRAREIASGICKQALEAVDQLRRNAAELAEAIDRDAASYDAVMAAYKLRRKARRKKRTREETISSHTRCCGSALQVAERSVALFERLGQLASIAAASMKSDLGSGAADGRRRRTRSFGECGDSISTASPTQVT